VDENNAVFDVAYGLYCAEEPARGAWNPSCTLEQNRSSKYSYDCIRLVVYIQDFAVSDRLESGHTSSFASPFAAARESD